MNNLGSIIKWFNKHENYIINNGENISSQMYGFLNINNSYELRNKIKIIYIDEIPFPKELQQYSQFKHKPRGLAVGNGIYIDKKYKDDIVLLKHEIIHVIQYNRFDSLASFIKQYIKEYLQDGYIEMPLEKEARLKSVL